MSTTETEVIEFIESPIVEFRQFDKDLILFTEKYKNNIYDFDDPKQAKQAGTDRVTIAHTITALKAAYDEKKAPMLVEFDILKSERNRIRDALNGTRLLIANQEKANKEKLAAIEAELQAKVWEIRMLAEREWIANHTADEINTAITSLKSLVIDDSFGSRRASAALAKEDALTDLRTGYHAMVIHEKEQAELEALRKADAERLQKERDEQIRKDEAQRQEQARKEQAERHERELKSAAEAAEVARKASAEKVERDRAEAKRLEDARKSRVEQDKKDAAEKAERDKKLAIEAVEQRRAADQLIADALVAKEKRDEEKRQANRKHRAMVRNEIVFDLVDRGIAEMTANSIMIDIDAGKIRNLSIKY